MADSGERDSNRRAYESVTRRLVEHSSQQGKPMSNAEARKVAGEAARTGDRNRDENRRKGRIR